MNSSWVLAEGVLGWDGMGEEEQEEGMRQNCECEGKDGRTKARCECLNECVLQRGQRRENKNKKDDEHSEAKKRRREKERNREERAEEKEKKKKESTVGFPITFDIPLHHRHKGRKGTTADRQTDRQTDKQADRTRALLRVFVRVVGVVVVVVLRLSLFTHSPCTHSLTHGATPSIIERDMQYPFIC